MTGRVGGICRFGKTDELTMCNRYTTLATGKIISEYEIEQLWLDSMPRRYNVAPSQDVAVLFPDEHDLLTLGGFHWGLYPSWAKARKMKELTIIRSDTVEDHKTFTPDLLQRRCGLAADGFFEWKEIGTKPNRKPLTQPYYFQLVDRELFLLAGIYEEERVPGTDRPSRRCAILTTEPNELMQGIHKRMPVVIEKKDEAAWLDRDNKNLKSLLKILKPYPSDLMRAYPVGKYVNYSLNEGPQCIEPLVPEDEGAMSADQTTLQFES